MLFKNKFTKILTSAGLGLTVLATPVVAKNVLSNNNIANAYYVNNTLDSLIGNADFSSSSSSTTPASPSSWTELNPTNTSNVKAGVINTYSTVYADKKADYGLENIENPKYPSGEIPSGEGDPLYKNLMINNTSDKAVRFGYESSSFTLEANSYYSIHVQIKTIATKDSSDKASASIYLTGLKDENISAKIETFETSANEFEEYVIYVSTHALQSESVTLQIWLGGNQIGMESLGALFVNSVSIKKYDQQSFHNRTYNLTANSPAKDKELYINLNSGTLNYAPVENADFQQQSSTNSISGWQFLTSTNFDDKQVAKIVKVGKNYTNPLSDKNITNPGSCGSILEDNTITEIDDSALFMYNKNETSQGIKSSSFTIKQHALYKLSVMAKSDCGIGNGATIKVVEDVNDSSTTTAQSASLTTATSVTQNEYTNGWTEYSFYIEGNALKDINAHIEVWLGTQDTSTNGYVFVDSIKLMNVTRSEFTNGSTASNSTTLDLNLGSKENDGLLISNGNFNITDNEEDTLNYPLAPNNWTFVNEDEVDEKELFKGIINTSNEFFTEYASQLPKNLKNPGAIEGNLYGDNNNVLVVGSNRIANVGYKSNELSLEANSYYKVTFNINTQISKIPNTLGGASVSLLADSTVVFAHNNITTSGWKTYTVYIKTASTSQNISLQLGIDNIAGYVFYDNVNAVKLADTFTSDNFNDVINNVSNLTQAVDLSKDSFDSYDVSDSGLFAEPTNWTFSTVEGFAPYKNGIFNFENNDIKYVLPSLSGTHNSKSGKNALVIYSQDETYSTYTSKTSYKLESGKYYSISVSIKTADIYKENPQYDDDDNLIKYGAYFGLSGITESFTGISSEYNFETDYTTYTYYISPSSEITTNIVLGLGNANNQCSGAVFFDDVEFKEMDESSYKVAVSKLTGSEYNYINITNTTTDEETTDDGYVNPEVNWLIIPSIILSIAIIIAIIGTVLRKINFKQHLKIKTKYDRRITLDKDMDRRERIELRKQIISELEQELKNSDEELANLIKMFDEEEKQIKKANKEFVENVLKTKENLSKEKEKAIAEHKELIQNASATEKTDKAEKEFIKNVARIEKQQKIEDAKLNQKDKAMIKLQLKRKQNIEMYDEKRKNLLIEIHKIEQEIKDIENEEKIMWSEYSKAKQSSKQKNKLTKQSSTKPTKKEVKEELKEVKKEEVKEENNNSEETNSNNSEKSE